MHRIGFLLLLLYISISGFGQHSYAVKGTTYDTLAKQPVPSATITVLKKKDSSLVSFTMADNNGKFEITGIENTELPDELATH